MELFDLAGKVAVVTGSSRGLGSSIVKGLAEAGAKVVVSGRSSEGVAEVTLQLTNSGHEAEGVVFDATSRQECQRLIDKTVSRFGRLDVLVANHGIGEFDKALDLSDEAWDRTMEINLTSVLRAVPGDPVGAKARG